MKLLRSKKKYFQSNKKILFFSNNAGKTEEIKKLFKKYKINLCSLADFNLNLEPKETGNSFADNAKIKSLFGYEKIKLPCFADDSGICIEALGWKPGVYSKRFIENFKNNDECFKYIFKKVLESRKYRAYFQTSICLTLKNNYHIVFEGKINGKISTKSIGKNGFGFDPIFTPDMYQKTFGQMKSYEKNSISHRSIAINKLLNFLAN